MSFPEEKSVPQTSNFCRISGGLGGVDGGQRVLGGWNLGMPTKVGDGKGKVIFPLTLRGRNFES